MHVVVSNCPNEVHFAFEFVENQHSVSCFPVCRSDYLCCQLSTLSKPPLGRPSTHVGPVTRRWRSRHMLVVFPLDYFGHGIIFVKNGLQIVFGSCDCAFPGHFTDCSLARVRSRQAHDSTLNQPPSYQPVLSATHKQLPIHLTTSSTTKQRTILECKKGLNSGSSFDPPSFSK